MSFFLNFTPPTIGKDLKLKELTFEHYRTLNKFLINNNSKHIEEYFNLILSDCLFEKDILPKLTNFDKFCALFLLRCTCISPEVEFKQNNAPGKASLLPFLQKCLDFKSGFTTCISLNGLTINVTLPKIFHFETLFDVLYDCIDSVIFEEKEVFFNTKQELIDILPAEILKDLKIFSDNLIKDFDTLVLNVGVSDKEKFAISPFNLSLFEILKALFSANLKNILELQYVLVSKMRYPPEFIDKNTLVENLILTNIYEADIKQQNEEQAKPIDKLTPQPK